ncbi:MAG: hypothetical protein WCO51_12775 [bacterium]
MIDETTRKALLKELEKSDNVYAACHKVGVATATYYRWIQGDKKFKKDTTAARRIGRLNIGDISEHALLIKIKEGNMEAIKFGLRYNHKRYMAKKENKYVFEHISASKTPIKERTLEDLIDEQNQLNAAIEMTELEAKKKLEGGENT